MDKKTTKIVLHVDVAFKIYAVSILTGITFDGFIDCSSIKQENGTYTHEGYFLPQEILLLFKVLLSTRLESNSISRIALLNFFVVQKRKAIQTTVAQRFMVHNGTKVLLNSNFLYFQDFRYIKENISWRTNKNSNSNSDRL